ncbi:MAG: BMP family ABC transporter substrate-binding protein [Clostridiaceae bacterium]|nr:BMP family ABC transporter substrate-binding protein [Clostridiaceae bacterium]
MFKKGLVLFLALVMVMTIFTGCAQPAQAPAAPAEPDPAEEAKPELSFGMITDVGGLGDKSFNDSAWEGIQKAGKELGVEPVILQSTKQEDYEANIGNMAQSVDLSIAVGFLMEQAMKVGSEQYPDVKFGIIDTVVTTPNVMSVTFKEHEGSFLVGVIAGLATKTNVIGFVGGMDFPLIQKFEVGFIAGVKSVNPNAKVLVNYTGAFDNPDKGKEIAISQFKQKADVIYHASGGCGIGVIQAADENDFWAIGVDQDQSAVSNNNKVLCSMIKRVDVGTYTIIKAYADDKFEGGKAIELGLKEEGVGFSDNGKNVSAEIKAVADKAKELVVNGTIVVPVTREDLEAFKPVEIK